jgi:hypothetical protein
MRIPAACSSSGDDGGNGDARKARVFFERGSKVAEGGHFEYAIEMFLSGLSLDPDNLDAHHELRKIALLRAARGGRDLGMLKKTALKRWTADVKQNMLNIEQLLAYDPGNTEHMLSLLQNARRAELTQIAEWVEQLIRRATGR